MEDVSLTETELRYFSDLFLCCDVEKTGKIPTLKATELYRSANLPNDVISEITSLAGIPETALHISRAQFYSCLKLIAAYQASMPLRQELIVASVQLPLPRFSWKDSPSGADFSHSFPTLLHPHHHHHQQQQQPQQQQHMQQQSNGFTTIPPPPVAERKNSLPRRADWQESAGSVSILSGSRRNSVAHQQQQQEAAANSDVHSTDSEVEQNESSCGGVGGIGGGGTVSSSRDTHRRRGSPEAWSTNSDSPTPTNSVAERPWAKETLWQGLLGDEHRQLLGTEEESSDRHSSDEDNETDLETVYQITPEQREYYFKQFKAVQHNTNGLLSGPVARVFFEKSRIPVEELRHIWQLCDVTRDGALSLAEFTAAMHLVVLRRYNIPLPSVLPTCLHPSVLQTGHMPPQEPAEADLLHLNDDDDEDNTDNTVVGTNVSAGTAAIRASTEKNVMNMSTISTSSQASNNSRQGVNATVSTHASLTPPSLPQVKNRSVSNSPHLESNSTPPNLSTTVPAVAKPKDRTLWTAISNDVPPSQWTKFTESPTSNVSSPGPKPVNFDMQRTAQAVVSDPQILHPVPLRVTPVGGAMANSTTDAHGSDVYDGAAIALCDTSPKPQLQAPSGSAAAPPHHRDVMQSNDLRAIQRPQAKKLPAKNIGALPPPPQRESSIGSAGSTTAVGSAGGDNGELSNGGQAVLQQQPQLPLPVHQAVLSKKEPPPLPPPRPHRHGRSSSLDLKKFKMNAPAGQQPEITAQASFDLQTSAGFADFTNFPDGAHANEQIPDRQQHSLPPQVIAASGGAGNCASTHNSQPPTRFSLQSEQRVSAFEVYRKPNTPRNSQSPAALAVVTAGVAPAVLEATTTDTSQSLHHQPQPTQPPPPAPVPFGAAGAAAIGQLAVQPDTGAGAAAVSAALPNADFYEKRVNAISETLRHVSFKQDNNMSDILRHLREQNSLLLRLCNDLSDELLTVQTRKEEMRLRLESVNANANEVNTIGSLPIGSQLTRTGSSISAPVTANVTGGSGSSGVHSNV